MRSSHFLRPQRIEFLEALNDLRIPLSQIPALGLSTRNISEKTGVSWSGVKWTMLPINYPANRSRVREKA